ncbi:MAG TPA: hypothetical protein VFH29_04835 [Anaerolineales bacterium]|nr:hypothetical protein [Anaerolineales bacterium]
MDNSLTQAGSEPRRSESLLTKFAAVRRMLNWLTSLFVLSDEQQEQAGIHLSRHDRR